MIAKITRYPNDEVRIAVYREKFPKSLEELNGGSSSDESAPSDEPQTANPVSAFSSPDSTRDSAFNIKSKVDTPARPRKLYLSRNGRNTVLRAGSCFSQGSDTERLLLTGTLPGRLREAHCALAEFSTYATKTLTNWLTRRSPGCKWMYTWEFQKRGALHVHLVVELPIAVAQYVKEFFQDEWNRILSAISKKSGVNLYKRTHKYVHSKKVTQADVTVCDREPSRYISKYISKGSTNGFGQWRYPPKTWYQVSRSLLHELRQKTKTYIAEGLTYRQARTFVEDATHCISQCVKGGQRYFDGAIFAWSGYCYSENFDIKEWSQIMNKKDRILMSIKAVHAMSLQAYNANMNARCHLRSMNKGIEGRIKSDGNKADELMLEEIKLIMQATTATLQYTARKGFQANYVRAVILWWEAKYDECPINESAALAIFELCEEGLTS